MDDAEARGDAERTAPAAELTTLTAELALAVGLGGRGRRVGAAAERARVNVQHRLADALRRIADEAPASDATRPGRSAPVVLRARLGATAPWRRAR
jgi:hypothetical protein